MGRKGMKGFMKSASRPSNKPEEEELQQPSTTVTPVQQPTSTSMETNNNNSAQIQINGADTTIADVLDQSEEDSKQETKGQMLQRHKREMLAHKKAVQRMGKKSKDELAKLDAEIEARHAQELQQLEAAVSNSTSSEAPTAAAAAQTASAVDGSAEEANKASKYLKDLSLGDAEAEDVSTTGKKMTKAQKRREKQATKEAEREARIAAEQAALGPSQREEEEKALKALLQPLGLGIKEIRADGHCLYRSVEDQLTVTAAAAAAAAGGGEQNGDAPAVPNHQELREMAAKYIREHKDDFAPFLLPEDESEDFDTHFEQYCTTLETTAAWGGHLELQALSHALKRQIKVHAVGMATQTLGDDYAGDDKRPALDICYLRHAFGLGEHYNSTKQQRSVRFSTEHEYFEHEGPIPSSAEDTEDDTDSDEESSEQ